MKRCLLLFLIGMLVSCWAGPVGATASVALRTTGRVVPIAVVLTSSASVAVSLPSSLRAGDEVDLLTTRLASQHEAGVWCTPGSFRLLECSSSPVSAENSSGSPSDTLLNGTYRLLALAPRGACLKLITTPMTAMDIAHAGTSKDNLQQLTVMSVIAPPARTGTLDPVVLLVDFSDRPAQSVSTPAFFADLLFAQTGQRKSLRDYYADTSYSKLDVAGDVFPKSGAWLRLPMPFSYYNSYDAAATGNSRPHFDDFLADVCALADPVVDFSQHDANKDGVVDGVIIVYAGKSDMPWAKGLWPCCTSAVWKVDGVSTSHVTVQNEYNDKPGDTTIGVFCHEFAHSLGTRDLYSYDNFSDAGSWSLMSENSGLLDPWHRIYLGWAHATDVTQDGACTLKCAEGSDPEETIVRVMLHSPNEYLLVEDRQQQGWDSAQPGHGLLVWHIDESTNNNDHPWYPGNTDKGHLFDALLQADGYYDLETKTNSGDAGDCWHAGQTLSPSSVPSSLAYDRTGAGVQIDGIQEAADGSVSFVIHITKNAVIAPGEPELTATPFSHGTRLQWAEAAQGSFPIKSYTILRSAAADMANAVTVATLPATVRAYFDTSAPLHVTAWYEVVARDDQAQSNSSTIRTPQPASPGECGLVGLFTGVKKITDTKYPGDLDLSRGAIPLVVSDSRFKRPNAALVGAAVSGGGRVLAFGHDGFFGDNTALADSQTFGQNALKWLCGSNAHGSIIMATGHGERERTLGRLSSVLAMSGHRLIEADGAITATTLDSAAVLVVGCAWTPFTDAELSTVQDFVHAGGGLLLLGCGWSWTGKAGNPSILQYPMNAVGKLFGIQWNSNCLWTNGEKLADAPVFTAFYPTTLPGGQQSVTATATEHGLVSPMVQKTGGSNIWMISLSPDPGYRLATVTDNGIDVTTQVNGNVYAAPTGNISHQVHVAFESDDSIPPLSIQFGESCTATDDFLLTRLASVPIAVTACPVREGPLTAKVMLDGAVAAQCADISPSGWPVSITVDEGAHPLTVSVADGSGAVNRKETTLFRDSTAPTLTIDAMPATVTTPFVSVTGTASDAGSGLSRLWIAGQDVDVDANGRFKCEVALTAGPNTIDVSAFDRADNLTSKSIVVTAQHLEETTVITLQIGSPAMTVGNASQRIDAQGTVPLISKGTTLVPIRAIVEALGGSTAWDASSATIVIKLDTTSIILSIGSTTALVNGKNRPLTVPASIVASRTMVPLRFVAESLGCTVTWDPETKVISITHE